MSQAKSVRQEVHVSQRGRKGKLAAAADDLQWINPGLMTPEGRRVAIAGAGDFPTFFKLVSEPYEHATPPNEGALNAIGHTLESKEVGHFVLCGIFSGTIV